MGMFSQHYRDKLAAHAADRKGSESGVKARRAAKNTGVKNCSSDEVTVKF